ncbi:interleukin-9 receptor isoform X3 [Panthera pardus]|uniref:Interleukin-9 receptor isoform X3 n=1 Tax=Panthera pardus TaxID=9691 RepID=A0A9V1F4N3_PANPR|nr:interleukin-9 receptor isoform X3 [Panthera pardus]
MQQTLHRPKVESPKPTFGVMGKEGSSHLLVPGFMISGSSCLSTPLGTAALICIVVSDVGGLCEPAVGGSRHCSLQLYPESGRETSLQTQERSPPGLEVGGWGALRLAMGPSRCIWEGLGAGSFICLNNNILRIDCHWSAVELGQGPSPWLLFTSNHAVGSNHRCVFRASECTLVLPPEEVLVPSDNFTITFHRYVSGKEQVSLVDPQYLPRRHVKLDPPSDLQSNVSSDYCVLTWSVSPALEPLISMLSYELAFKRQGETWEQAQHRDHIFGVTWLRLEAIELDPGSSYEARLRVQMASPEDDLAEEQHYAGQWSDWSQPVCFPSPQTSARGPLLSPRGQPDGTLVAVPVFLLLTSLTCLLFKLSPRVKRSFYQNVPSPVAFFQSLYSVHNGDFQTWIGAHRTGLLPSQDCVSSPRRASESSVQEAIAWLTYGPVDPWQSVVLEEEEKGPRPGLPEAVLLAGLVAQGEQPPAYLPQEDWVPGSPTRPALPQAEGSSGDYCALGCPGACHPSTFPGNTQSSGPSLALACGLSCDQQSLDATQGGTYVGVGHREEQDPGECVA